METLGKNNLLLSCIVSEDPEYIISHSYTLTKANIILFHYYYDTSLHKGINDQNI